MLCYIYIYITYTYTCIHICIYTHTHVSILSKKMPELCRQHMTRYFAYVVWSHPPTTRRREASPVITCQGRFRDGWPRYTSGTGPWHLRKAFQVGQLSKGEGIKRSGHQPCPFPQHFLSRRSPKEPKGQFNTSTSFGLSELLVSAGATVG